MNIDNMTYGELKQIAAMFSMPAAAQTVPHPFVGQYVIARGYSFGVHAGEVVSVDGENVILKDSRRLWSWKAEVPLGFLLLTTRMRRSGKHLAA